MSKFRLASLLGRNQTNNNTQSSSQTAQAASKSSILSRIKAKLTGHSSQSASTPSLPDNFVPPGGRTRANAVLVTRHRAAATYSAEPSTTLSTVSQQSPVLPLNSSTVIPTLVAQRSSSSISVSSTATNGDSPVDSPQLTADSLTSTSDIEVSSVAPDSSQATPDKKTIARQAVEHLGKQIQSSKLGPAAQQRAGKALDDISKTIEAEGLDLSDDGWDVVQEAFDDLKDEVKGLPDLHVKTVQLSNAVLDDDGDGDFTDVTPWAGAAVSTPASPDDGQKLQDVSPVNADAVNAPLQNGVDKPETPLEQQVSVSNVQGAADDAEQGIPLDTALQQFTKYLGDARANDRLGASVVTDAKYSLHPLALRDYPKAASIEALQALNIFLDENASDAEVSAKLVEVMKKYPLEQPQAVTSPSAKKLDPAQQKIISSVCQDAFAMSPQQLKQTVAELLNLPKDAVDVMNITPTSSNDYGDGISIHLTQPKGIVENMVVSFYPKQQGADHDGHLDLGVIKLQKGKQGGGAAKKMFRGVLGLMKKSSLETMSLEANITVGGYLWGRMGFYPRPGAFDLHALPGQPPKLGSVKGHLQNFLDAVDGGKTSIELTDDQKDHLKSIITRLNDPQSVDSRAMIRELSQLSIPVPLNELHNLFPSNRADRLNEIAGNGGQKQLTLGKALLLGTSWDGTFKAKGNNNDMGHMLKYVATSKVKSGFGKLFGKKKSTND